MQRTLSRLADAGRVRWGTRIVAVSLAAAVPAIGAQGIDAAPLPDGRAYELVSPSAKNLGEIVRALRASDDGNLIGFGITAGIPGAQATHVNSYFVAKRTSEGWALTPADAPGHAFPASGGPSGLDLSDLNPSFTQLLELSSPPLAPDDFGSGIDLYSLPVGAGTADWLSRPQGVPLVGTSTVRYGGAPEDLSRAYFTVDLGKRLPDAPDSALYESRDGALSLVSVLPNGDPSPGYVAASPGSRSGLDVASFSGLAVPHRGPHAVSDDGSRVFWTTAPAPQVTPLYLSEDGQTTRVVSVSKRTGHEGEIAGANFVAATHDGSMAYIASADMLTDDAAGGQELYRFDTASGDITRITSTGADGQGANVGQAITSDDLSHIYFTASGVLAPGAQQDAVNAYVWRGGQIRFIATLDPFSHVSRVSRDGSVAVFESPASVNGAKNDGHVAVYAYYYGSNSMRCISCRPDGSASEADASVGESLFTVPPGNAQTGTQRVRNVTDDGRIFFMTKDQLVKDDINSAYDVYEYDNGNVFLLTDGRNDYDSYLADNGDDGRDVFLITRSRLVPSDTDELYDLYDARSGGGFPVSDHSLAPCSGDDCQGAALPRPNLPAPRSMAPSSETGGSTGPKTTPAKRVSIARLRASQLRQIRRTGTVTLSVRVAGGGALTVKAKADVGGHAITMASARRAVRGTSAATVKVRLRLARVARRQLARHGKLTMVFEARLPGASISRRTATVHTTKASR